MTRAERRRKKLGRPEREDTHATREIARIRKANGGSLMGALLNFSRRIKREDGRIRVSIWPEGKTVKPGRMA